MSALKKILLLSSFFLSLGIWTPSYSVKLPPDAQRDVYVVALAKHLKNEQWNKAYPLFAKIDAITRKHNLEVDGTVIFYRGEVAFHLEKFSEAQRYLGDYIARAGSQGNNYLKSLQLLSEIDNKAAEIYQKGNPLLGGGYPKAEKYWLKNVDVLKPVQTPHLDP